MRLDQIIRSAISRAGVVQVQNALAPFLWAFVWSVIFGSLTYLFKDDATVKYVCLALAAIPELAALGIGIGFAVYDRDRLQSEKFVIRQQEIRQREIKILYKHGANPKILDATKNIEHVEPKRLSADAGDEE